MKNQKMYEAGDKMVSLISDNYDLLQSLGRFGINLGFGDKTVDEVCHEEGVDTYTFLAVVNFSMNGYVSSGGYDSLSVPTLLHYLEASHEYYLNFELPCMRRELEEALDASDSLARLILRMYDEFAGEVRKHMRYEEEKVFPYVRGIIAGKVDEGYDIETFSKHHDQVDMKLFELKNVIIKYIPGNSHSNNRLITTLHGLYKNEEWLKQHARVEDMMFIPAISELENKLKKSDVSVKISKMISRNADGTETLGQREKDVIIGVVQGMSNKEIAEHLFISVNTVITHRRNIARKLQIHSPAGLTIYAIVNKLVDISEVRL